MSPASVPCAAEAEPEQRCSCSRHRGRPDHAIRAVRASPRLRRSVIRIEFGEIPLKKLDGCLQRFERVLERLPSELEMSFEVPGRWKIIDFAGSTVLGEFVGELNARLGHDPSYTQYTKMRESICSSFAERSLLIILYN